MLRRKICLLHTIVSGWSHAHTYIYIYIYVHVLLKEEIKKQARSMYIMFLCQSVNPVPCSRNSRLELHSTPTRP